MSEKPVFIYLAAYASTADTLADFEVLKDLKADGSIEGFDAELTRADRSLERRVQDAAETLKHQLEAAR